MKRILAALGILLAGFATAAAQAPFPQTLPPNTVVGRLGVSAGPAQAIPFSVLTSNLFSTGFCTTSGAFPIFNATLGAWKCSTVGGTGSLATLNGGPLTINPASGTTNRGFAINQSGPNTGSTVGSLSYNYIVLNDGANVTGADIRTWGLYIQHNILSNAAGHKYALGTDVLFDTAADTNGDLIGHVPRVVVSATNGGTAMSPKGGVYGDNPVAILQSGATGWAQISGSEVDVGVFTGASTEKRFGFSVVNIGNQRATLGTPLDSALEIGSVDSGGSFKNLFMFTSYHGAAGMLSTGDLIGADTGAVTIANAWDFNLFTISGNVLRCPSNTCSIAGSGLITGNRATAGSTSIKSNGRLEIAGHSGETSAVTVYTPNSTSSSYLFVDTSSNWTWQNPSTQTLMSLSSAGLLTVGQSTIGGKVALSGTTSGTVTLASRAAAGTPTVTFGTSSGTPAVTATSPLAINTTTGDITCSTCLTNTPAALTKVDDTNVTLTLGGTPATALLQATSLTLGWTGQLGLTRGGTAASLTASNGGIVYSTASAMAILSGTATAGQILRSGSSAAPSWSTATYPATAGTAGNVLRSDGTNFLSATLAGSDVTGAALTKTDDTNVTLTLGGTPTTALLRAASITVGWTGRLALSRFVQGATNTVLANATSGTADFAAFSMPSCSTSSSALNWTTNTGFGCNTSINAATLLSGTWAIPGTIGSTTPNTGAFTTIAATDLIDVVTGNTHGYYIAGVPALNRSGNYTLVYSGDLGEAFSFGTSADPQVYLSNDGAIFRTRNAATTYGTLTNGTAVFNGYVKTGTTTVGSLPTCNSGTKGARHFVTDANSTTFHATAVGGGANNMGVTCDGTNWYLSANDNIPQDQMRKYA